MPSRTAFFNRIENECWWTKKAANERSKIVFIHQHGGHDVTCSEPPFVYGTSLGGSAL